MTAVGTHEFEIKAGDRLPALSTTLLDGDGNPVDLTAATDVALNMVLVDYPNTVVLSLISASFAHNATGVVTFDWRAGDTDAAGLYDIEWVVTFASGKQQTFPSKGHDRVLVSARLT